MAHRRLSQSLIWFCAWGAAAIAGTILVGVASIAVSGWLVSGVEDVNGGRQAAMERSAIGNYFGGMSAVFSGLALLLLVVTLLFQQRELRMQRQELALQRQELIASRDELRRSAEADLRALHVQLTQMVMDDPHLAQVWNDYPDEEPEVVRQYLFANLTFGHYLLVYKWGGITETALLEYARSLIRSPAFRRYWAASRAAKQGLPPDSDEGKLFRIIDRAIHEARNGGAAGAS